MVGLRAKNKYNFFKKFILKRGYYCLRNKIANSGSFNHYIKIKQAFLENMVEIKRFR